MTAETNAERKVPLKDIKTGDSVYLYEWSGGEMRKEVEFRVDSIVEFSKGINIELTDGEGRQKRYCFLDGDQLMNLEPITDHPITLDGETEVQKLRTENARLQKEIQTMRHHILNVCNNVGAFPKATVKDYVQGVFKDYLPKGEAE